MMMAPMPAWPSQCTSCALGPAAIRSGTTANVGYTEGRIAVCRSRCQRSRPTLLKNACVAAIMVSARAASAACARLPRSARNMRFKSASIKRWPAAMASMLPTQTIRLTARLDGARRSSTWASTSMGPVSSPCTPTDTSTAGRAARSGEASVMMPWAGWLTAKPASVKRAARALKSADASWRTAAVRVPAMALRCRGVGRLGQGPHVQHGLLEVGRRRVAGQAHGAGDGAHGVERLGAAVRLGQHLHQQTLLGAAQGLHGVVAQLFLRLAGGGQLQAPLQGVDAGLATQGHAHLQELGQAHAGRTLHRHGGKQESGDRLDGVDGLPGFR